MSQDIEEIASQLCAFDFNECIVALPILFQVKAPYEWNNHFLGHSSNEAVLLLLFLLLFNQLVIRLSFIESVIFGCFLEISWFRLLNVWFLILSLFKLVNN